MLGLYRAERTDSDPRGNRRGFASPACWSGTLWRDAEIRTLSKKASAHVDRKFLEVFEITVLLALIAFYAYNWLRPVMPLWERVHGTDAERASPGTTLGKRVWEASLATAIRSEPYSATGAG